MSGQSIDFQGIVEFDRKIVEQLEQFLQEKENRLAHQILNIIPSITEAFVPSLPSLEVPIKLSEAVEGFSKKVRLLINNKNARHHSDNSSDQIVKDINAIFWEFTEILEGSTAELFQQLHQIPLNRWNRSISEVIHAIKDILIRYIDDLVWIIRRLEKPLQEYRQKFPLKKGKKWFQWFSFGDSYLDRHLLKNLQQTEKFLKNQYENFQQRYNEYSKLGEQVEGIFEKMKRYSVLALLDSVDRNLYLDVCRLLKIIELNPQPKKEVGLDSVRALKRLTSIDSVIKIFRIYSKELKDALFNSCLEWKTLNREKETFRDNHDKLKGKVSDYQEEVRDLMRVMSSYRNFILKNDSNPYVRSRWGFSERVVGPEPVKAKKIVNMIYSAKELDEYFTHFTESLARDLDVYQKNESQLHQEIENILHEMGQPLISRSRMRNNAERILNQLWLCDEIGSPQMSTIYYVEEVLSKMMRQDWKYHVLHEFSLFHQIYDLHQGLMDHFDDPAHAFRLERFRLLFDQINEWVEKEDIYSHVHEIDLDMSDMKTYLQDFLAAIQRIGKDKPQDPFFDETLHKLRQQLLEYRYIFGHFFSFIMSKSFEGVQLRHQFLFVDQYFESAENLLNELSNSREERIDT